MPQSFFEDDVVDFPDDLDTSFFTRVSSDVIHWRCEKTKHKTGNVNSFHSTKAKCGSFLSPLVVKKHTA